MVHVIYVLFPIILPIMGFVCTKGPVWYLILKIQKCQIIVYNVKNNICLIKEDA